MTDRARLAAAWDEGAYAGREYQKRLTEWATTPTFLGQGPELAANPYRAALDHESLPWHKALDEGGNK